MRDLIERLEEAKREVWTDLDNPIPKDAVIYIDGDDIDPLSYAMKAGANPREWVDYMIWSAADIKGAKYKVKGVNKGWMKLVLNDKDRTEVDVKIELRAS